MGQVQEIRQPEEGQFEPLLTPQDVAVIFNVSPKTVQRMFMDEPGVVVLGEEDRRDGKRQYVQLRIPPSVVQRVRQRRTR